MGCARFASVSAGFAALVVLLPACSSSNRRAPTVFSAQGALWQVKPSGDVFITAGSKPGTATNADVSSSLGLDTERTWTGRVALDLDTQRFSLEALPLHLHGTTNADKNFTFHGAGYGGGDSITTDLNLDTWIAKWEVGTSTSAKTADAIRGGIGLYWWHFDSQVVDGTNGSDESRKFSHLYPSVNGSATLDAGHGLRIEFATAFAATGRKRQIRDLSAALGYQLSDAVDLSLGYRYLRFDFDESTNDGDFDLRGPFTALQIRF